MGDSARRNATMSETSAFSKDQQQQPHGGNGAAAPGRRLLRRPNDG
jgi:hypothetical protein